MKKYIKQRPGDKRPSRIHRMRLFMTLMWLAAILFVSSRTLDYLDRPDSIIQAFEALEEKKTEKEEATLLAAIPAPVEGWNEFVRAVDKVAPIYNFPRNVVLAQGALESARGTSAFAVNRNNYLGIGAYDENPNNAFFYENAEQCVIEYMRLIKRNFPQAWENRDNPEALLHALKVNRNGLQYATDPNYEAKVKNMPEWKI